MKRLSILSAILFSIFGCRAQHGGSNSAETAGSPIVTETEPQQEPKSEDAVKPEDIPAVDPPKPGEPPVVIEEQPTPEPTEEPVVVEEEEEEPEPYVDVLGIRNYQQINETMASLTGVSTQDQKIASVYSAVNGQLPLTNDAGAFSGANQVAISKLAVEYCDVTIESATLRSLLIPGFNFDAGISTAFSLENKKLVANTLVNKFWGSLMFRPDAAATEATLLTMTDEILMEQIRLGRSQTSSQITRNVVKGVCGAVLSSAPVVFF